MRSATTITSIAFNNKTRRPVKRRRKELRSIPIPSFSNALVPKIDLSILDSPGNGEDDNKDGANFVGSSNGAKLLPTNASSPKAAMTTHPIGLKIDRSVSSKTIDQETAQDSPRTKSHAAKRKAPIPSTTVLYKAVDKLFSVHMNDAGSITVKEFLRACERECGGNKFDKATRHLVKERLKSLINRPPHPGEALSKAVSVSGEVSSLQTESTEKASEKVDLRVEAAGATSVTASMPDTTLRPGKPLSPKLTVRTREHQSSPARVSMGADSTAEINSKPRDVQKLHEMGSKVMNAAESRKQSHTRASTSIGLAGSIKQKVPDPSRAPDFENPHLPVDTISLLDEDDDDDFNVNFAPTFARSLNIPEPSKPLDAKPAKPKRGPRKRQTTSVSSQNTKSAEKTNAAPTPIPVTRKGAAWKTSRRKTGTCSLCITCPCTAKAQHSGSPVVFGGTDSASIERTLIQRVIKLERSVDRYEGDLDAAKRELRKHRRRMNQKQQQDSSARQQPKKLHGFGGSRFLPDVDDWDTHLQGIQQTKMGLPLVEEAKAYVFPPRPKVQPTLTQMMGGACSESLASEEKEEQAGEGDDEQPGVGHDYQDETEGDDRSTCDSTYETSAHVMESPLPLGYHRVNATAASTQSPTKSAWAFATVPSETAHGASCPWDHLFEDNLMDDADGVDELLDMFEMEKSVIDGPPSQEGDDQKRSPVPSPVSLSMLSQRARVIAGTVEGSVIDSSREAGIEELNPRWRENVRFALAQTEASELQAALGRVQRRKERLGLLKQRVMEVWRRQHDLLALYETALTQSFRRLDEVGTSDENKNDGEVMDDMATEDTTVEATSQLGGEARDVEGSTCPLQEEAESKGAMEREDSPSTVVQSQDEHEMEAKSIFSMLTPS